jgi:hypothetical protein
MRAIRGKELVMPLLHHLLRHTGAS